MSTSIVTSSHRSQKKLPPTQSKKINYFIHEKSQIMEALQFTTFCLSQAVNYRSVQAHSQKYPQNTLVTLWHKSRMANKKRSSKDTTDLLFDSYTVLVSVHMGIETSSNVLWYGNPSFPTLSVVHGPNPDHDPLSRLYVVLELWNQSKSIVEKVYHYDRVIFNRFETWAFEIWPQIRAKRELPSPPLPLSFPLPFPFPPLPTSPPLRITKHYIYECPSGTSFAFVSGRRWVKSLWR